MFNTEPLVDDLCEQGYHLIEAFLPANDFSSLSQHAQELHQRQQFNPAKIGQNTQTQQHKAIRSDAIYWVDEDHENTGLRAYFQNIQHIMQALNQSLYLGLQETEFHFAAYQPGSYYRKHYDQFATTKNRKISCVYYLNTDWQESFGGQLELYDQHEQPLRTIFPQGNRFICFNSELLHEVKETQHLRYSLTGWIKTRGTAVI